MSEKIIVVTQNGNTKSRVWRDLGFSVVSGDLSELTGKAEDNYDQSLGIGPVAPLYPDKGRGFPYPVDVALEKNLAAILAAKYKVNEGKLAAADVCWMIQEPSGGWIALNKPGEDPRRIEDVISRWEGNIGKPVFNIAGAALYDKQSDSVSLWSVILEVGIINPETTRGELWDLIKKNANRSSGGLDIFDAYREKIFLPEKEGIKYHIYSYGSYGFNLIPGIPYNGFKINQPPKLLESGTLSFDAANNPGIYRLLFGI